MLCVNNAIADRKMARRYYRKTIQNNGTPKK